MKYQNDVIADLKRSMLLGIQSSPYKYSINVPSYVDSRFSVIVKECDDIFILGAMNILILSLFDNAFM